MLERELQEYLFDHPDVLVPDEAILEKSREFWIQSKRIDLLFRAERTRYIVELKAVPLTREHIGQVVEYYGLMREQIRDGQFKMVLVSPSIAAFQKLFLEELGIRCIEIPSIPGGQAETDRLRGQAVAQKKQQASNEALEKEFPISQGLHYGDLVSNVTKRSLSISHRMLKDTLPEIRRAFTPYEVLPIRMTRADSPDKILSSIPADIEASTSFVAGGAWWAYAFGESDRMPKNDIPNISAMAMPWGFDLAINAELLPSQAVFTSKIGAKPEVFDELLHDHGNLQFQVLLKLEHQPRFYYWIPIWLIEPGSFTGATVVEVVAAYRKTHHDIKQSWIAKITQAYMAMSNAQLEHMRSRNLRPNFALRLVRPFRHNDPIWKLPYKDQVATFLRECERLKPFIDFLR